MIEIKALRQATAEIVDLLGGVSRSTGGRAPKPLKAPKEKRASGSGAKSRRFRTSAADVERMYSALVAAVPSDWSTKAEICKAAGISVDDCAAAWKRATEGYEVDGVKHPAVLKSNGSRGLKGRYRKA